jgi:outer membrane protein assembly factor BamE (lipoprotein component of BamABCDE complex)
MRYIFFSLCLLANLWSFSQINPANKSIALMELSDWVTKKISINEVTKTLGTPIQEAVTPYETNCQYNYDGDIYTARFDKDGKLSSITFLDQVPVSVVNLSYEKVKEAKTVNNKQAVLASFGKPHRLEVMGSEEVWYYIIADKEGHKGLVVDFDLANAGRINRYSYDEEVQRETALTSSITTAFHVGASTSSEVEALLGKPSKLMMDSDGEERWFYHSQNSTLGVIFNKQSKLSDFYFQRNNTN